MAITLWKLATNIEYRTLSEMIGVGESTVGIVVMTYLLPKHVSIPAGDKLKEIVDGFESCLGFPQVAGAIDDTHIPIIHPDESASDYYNRKGYYSVIM